MMELEKAKLIAEAASVELAIASRNELIRSAASGGMSLREIEAATGIPRSTVQRIANATPLTEAEYLRLANVEVVARSEVVAIESVSRSLSDADASQDGSA